MIQLINNNKGIVLEAIIETLLMALKEKDSFTEKHSGRLPELVISLAKSISIPGNMIPHMGLFAQFHDIGKIAISDRILLKPTTLTKKETKEMRKHSEIGYRIAMALPDLAPIADWILKHHEWWNGNGYPLGLQGERIPLPCRILSICDAYDAMTNDRPYRKAMSKKEAIAELKRFSGIQFDPELVEKFVDMQKRGFYEV